VRSLRPVVLVVEDDRPLRSLLQELLEEEYSVEISATAQAGLTRLEAGGVDLLLLDLRLSDLDGQELCRRVRAREAKAWAEPHLPIVVLTAAADEAVREACFAAGADDYLPKPFDIDDLLGRIRLWMTAAGATPRAAACQAS
jgi:two-component system response regulator ArlR